MCDYFNLNIRSEEQGRVRRENSQKEPKTQYYYAKLPPEIPEKPFTAPAEPPVTVSLDQSQVPVHAPDPQLTSTRLAVLETVIVFLLPVKLMALTLTPVPGVLSVEG